MSLVTALQEANARLQLEVEALRESNAWYRARNLELLRLLSGKPTVSEECPSVLLALDSQLSASADNIVPFVRSEGAKL